MSKILDDVVERFVNDRFLEEKDKDSKLLKRSAEERIKQMIVEEVKQEATAEIEQRAKENMKREENEKKLEELKGIVWSGFVLAFLVGLLVNQVTEIIDCIKNGTGLETNTMWVTAILIIICFATFLIMFMNRVIKMYNELKK